MLCDDLISPQGLMGNVLMYSCVANILVLISNPHNHKLFETLINFQMLKGPEMKQFESCYLKVF